MNYFKRIKFMDPTNIYVNIHVKLYIFTHTYIYSVKIHKIFAHLVHIPNICGACAYEYYAFFFPPKAKHR